MKIFDNKLYVLGLNLSIYDIVLTYGEPSVSPQVTYTIVDESGNSTTCTVDVHITDTHGYCCPDNLKVNYNPIEPIDYFASDSINASGLVQDGTTVNFRSSVINIDTSFQVNNGGTYQAIIENCDNN
jgi:hypothetical protein